MSRALHTLVPVSKWQRPRTAAENIQVGVLVGLDDQSRPLVSVAGGAPCLARCTVQRPRGELAGLPVVLLIEGGDDVLPIIIGFVRDVLALESPLLDITERLDGITLDGKRLQFEASEEVVLKCGKGSITLQANGRVVIKGTELVSRAERTNKIRGASVSIN